MVRQTMNAVRSDTARTARTKAVIPLAGVTAFVAVLAGCTAAPGDAESATTAPEPTAVVEPAAEATPTPKSTAPETCAGMSEVYSYTDGLYWERKGTLQDLGAREFARGEVTVDDDGVPVTYTVEHGDVEAVVAERLCAYPTLSTMNHRRDIHPGQVLWLTPDPDIPVLPYYSPYDTPAGFQQAPYQQAIETAGAAVDAGDLEAVRSIWNDTLKGMFSTPETIDAVQKIVDSGDLDALRQVFS